MEPYLFIWYIGWMIGMGIDIGATRKGANEKEWIIIITNLFIWPIRVGSILGK